MNLMSEYPVYFYYDLFIIKVNIYLKICIWTLTEQINIKIWIYSHSRNYDWVVFLWQYFFFLIFQHLAIKCSYFDRASTIGDVITVYSGNHGRTMVFCQTKRDADELAVSPSIKQDSQVLHGDIPQEKRERVLQVQCPNDKSVISCCKFYSAKTNNVIEWKRNQNEIPCILWPLWYREGSVLRQIFNWENLYFSSLNSHSSKLIMAFPFIKAFYDLPIRPK